MVARATRLILRLLLITTTVSFSTQSYGQSLKACQSAKLPSDRVAACSVVIESRPKPSVLEGALNSRGLANQEIGKIDAALADFTDLIRLNGKVAAYYDNRRSVYQTLHRFSEALQDANRAVELAPNHAFVYHSRAGLWKEMGNFQAALSDYSRAITLSPTHAFRWHDRGRVYLDLGNLELAVDDFTKALSLDPSWKHLLKLRGMALIKMGQIDRGRADILSFLRSEPNDEEARKYVDSPGLGRIDTQPSQPLDVAISGRRVALVIGNSQYIHAAPLNNPANDASALALALRLAGFQSVTLKTELSREQIISALREFANIADTADWAVVYYSGHGMELGGVNYMIPIDARLKVDRDVDLEAVDVGKVLSSIEGAKKLRLVILDACRDNPFISQMRRTASTRSLGRGLARIEPEAGTLVVYAAKHGELARWRSLFGSTARCDAGIPIKLTGRRNISIGVSRRRQPDFSMLAPPCPCRAAGDCGATPVPAQFAKRFAWDFITLRLAHPAAYERPTGRFAFRGGIIFQSPPNEDPSRSHSWTGEGGLFRRRECLPTDIEPTDQA